MFPDPPRDGILLPMDLFELAQSKAHIHRFSTLFTAEQVAKDFGDAKKIDEAIDWCRKTAVTHVYIESFRTATEVPSEILIESKRRFLDAGFKVSGCVTPTRVGKPSTRWKELISCYTDLPTQEKVGQIFRYAAKHFDDVMIDDFWFTDCACPECNAARESRTVKVAGKTFPVASDNWDDYRCELMVQISREYVLKAAREVNPKANMIIKYPQWYDRFHLRGYDVARETADFPSTWAGTETRDFPGPFEGNMPQYEAYFVMRWLLSLGREKCGGGWYDPYGTTEKTYIEQARQTILGGARESFLFCYGSLLRQTGPRNIEVLRKNIPELLHVAEQVAARKPIGVAAWKPANSHPLGEAFVYDYVGMLGFPLVPCHEFPADAPAVFLSTHALKDPDLNRKLNAYIGTERPILMTDRLYDGLSPLQLDLAQRHIRQLPVSGNPAGLLDLSQEKLDALRAPILAPLGYTLRAPARVAFYPFDDGSYVLENFRNDPATVVLNGQAIELPARGWHCHWAE